MFLFRVQFLHLSVKVELPRILQIDPRPLSASDSVNYINDEKFSAFEITYGNNGLSVTITNNSFWLSSKTWEFRVYDPMTEVVPSFDSTTYTYLGVKGERAPLNTVVAIIHPSVKVIQENAFINCTKMKVCLMHDDVGEIGKLAFYHCDVMKTIRLSRTLERIGLRAFYHCEAMKTIKLPQTVKRIGPNAFEDCFSLEALFIPPSVEEIEDDLCYQCKNLRILSLPPNITLKDMGEYIIQHCETFFRLTQVKEYKCDGVFALATNMDEVNQSILDFYHNMPPLIKVCLDTNVSIQSIQDCVRSHGAAAALATDHDGMTPLHILLMNPYATLGIVITCLQSNMSAAFVEDNSAKTPVDYLWEKKNFDSLAAVVQALCIHRMTNRESSSLDISEDSRKAKKKRLN